MANRKKRWKKVNHAFSAKKTVTLLTSTQFSDVFHSTLKCWNVNLSFLLCFAFTRLTYMFGKWKMFLIDKHKLELFWASLTISNECQLESSVLWHEVMDVLQELCYQRHWHSSFAVLFVHIAGWIISYAAHTKHHQTNKQTLKQQQKVNSTFRLVLFYLEK